MAEGNGKVRTIPEQFREMARERLAGKAGEPQETKREPVYTALADVQPEPVEWLWLHWLPEGAVSIIDGDPGLGKSTFCLDLAARITRGWAMPPGGGPEPGREPGGVILMTAEDSLKHTVRPRLDAAGADPARVYEFTKVKVGQEERPPMLPYDLELVEAKVREAQVRLIIVDPLLAFLGGEFDAHKDQDVRRGLRPLSELAERLNVVILLLRHLNKLNGGAALYRGGGSIAITGAARASLIVGRDPDNPKAHVLAMNKTNLGPRPRSLAYEIQPVEDGAARLAWLGETDLLADDIVTHQAGGKRGTSETAEEIIRQILKDGPLPARVFMQRCEAAGLSEGTVIRTRKKIGVQAKKNRFDGDWTVFLPGHNGAQPSEEFRE